MKPQLEEFMVFENNDGKMGVIIKSNDRYEWWKCYKDGSGGQVFNENDEHYNRIVKLYKTENERDKHFYALKFMNDGNINKYKCVYDKSKEPITIQIIIEPDAGIGQIYEQILLTLRNNGINI